MLTKLKSFLSSWLKAELCCGPIRIRKSLAVIWNILDQLLISPRQCPVLSNDNMLPIKYWFSTFSRIIIPSGDFPESGAFLPFRFHPLNRVCHPTLLRQNLEEQNKRAFRCLIFQTKGLNHSSFWRFIPADIKPLSQINATIWFWNTSFISTGLFGCFVIVRRTACGIVAEGTVWMVWRSITSAEYFTIHSSSESLNLTPRSPIHKWRRMRKLLWTESSLSHQPTLGPTLSDFPVRYVFHVFKSEITLLTHAKACTIVSLNDITLNAK